MEIKHKPILRGHFHQAMFFVALGALSALLLRTSGILKISAILIYSICTLLMFGISSLYHRINWATPEMRLRWKKLDHAGIYLMIAGTFTPVAVLALGPESRNHILIVIWCVALVGIIQSYLLPNLPKLVSALLYIIAGYLILPYVSELHANMGMKNVIFIFAGGLAYTIGGICYGLKWPGRSARYFGYHELFHLFVNFGAGFHYLAIQGMV